MGNLLDWSITDLEKWADKIEKKAKEFGLNFFEQIFEICSHKDMIGYMSYTGMPSYYPHWSFGKAFEITETLYRYRVSGLPYEMVINSNPSLAYLMRDNTLPMQILTIAHVYGHNDFFRNNISFGHTRPELILEQFKARADRVRNYIKDPSIGLEKVENLLDCARALYLQRSYNFRIKKLSREEQKQRLIDAHNKSKDKSDPPDLDKIPLEPEADILLFIRDHNPFLEDWEKDILTIVDEEARYFIPNIETKIMNEGWAVYWHYKILNSLDLPDALRLGFITEHNRVVARPDKGTSINPYYVGFKIWQDIEKRWGEERIFLSREIDRDTSFLRQYLTRELMEELDLYQHEQDEDERIITRISDEEDWQTVKELLIQNTGMNRIPSIKIVDANYHGQHDLVLYHEHDGRDLFQEYTAKTLQHFQRLWRRKVYLLTTEEGERVLYKCSHNKIKRIVPLKGEDYFRD